MAANGQLKQGRLRPRTTIVHSRRGAGLTAGFPITVRSEIRANEAFKLLERSADRKLGITGTDERLRFAGFQSTTASLGGAP
jgi:hypothetical protein